MKGYPFINNPQGWLCRPEERYLSRFLTSFSDREAQPNKKMMQTGASKRSVLAPKALGCEEYLRPYSSGNAIAADI
jgi:hypothetical protein